MTEGYRMLIQISEEEMRNVQEHTPPGVNGVPVYYCITASGTVRIWPLFNPKTMHLMVKP